MGGKAIYMDEIQLGTAKDGIITISVIEEPYGPDSEKVASIGVTLKKENKEPDWKVHIPRENIEEVIAALHFAKSKL